MNTRTPRRAHQLLLDLEAAAAARALSKAEIARATGLSVNTLAGLCVRPGRQRAQRATWNPTLRTIEALERFLLAQESTPRRRCKAQLSVSPDGIRGNGA